MIQKYSLLLISIILSCCPVMGQHSIKKYLTEQDYDKWGELNIKNISAQGRWISYEMNYENSADTLFLQNTKTKKIYTYPKGTQSSFGGDQLFGYLKGSDLILTTLNNFKLSIIKDVSRFDLLKDGAYIISHHNDNSLQVRNFEGVVLDRIENVIEYDLNSGNDVLIYNQEVNEHFTVGCVRLSGFEKSIITTGKDSFDSFTWNEAGGIVVFSNKNELQYYNLDEKQLFSFDVSTISGYEGSSIVKGGLSGFRISNDGKRVFFSIAQPSTNVISKFPKIVEVWNGNDAILYPTNQELETRDTPKLAVWTPSTAISKVLSDNSLSKVRLTGNSGYVLLFNPFTYGAIPKYYEDVNYYIKNVETEVQDLLLNKYSQDPNLLCLAPSTDDFVYYRDDNWWLYSTVNGSQKNLTERVDKAWDNASEDAPKQYKVYGVAGWSDDGNTVLIYDEFDIWEFSLDGSVQKRLTYGREEGKVYRISRVELEKHSFRAYDSGLTGLLNLNTALLFESTDSKHSSGYLLYSRSTGLKPLIVENKYYSDIRRSNNGDFVYSSQTFCQSPQVTFLKRGKRPITLFKSNKQQVNYHYGHSELIQYSNSRGENLNGVLFYPADYNEGKQYPMIVHVYEKMSNYLNHYVNPSLLNAQGFSVTNFTLNGYFVLMPDISYEIGNTGVSAADCIISAVKSILSNKAIDSTKIGLIGHSFGGYEANFTITQTNIFAAAVSGSGISDPIGRYFEIGTNGSPRSEMWRFENQQIRMGSSFFDNKLAYWQNSPLIHAEKITTPLLQWSGKEDSIIPFRQSVSYYMALRRLGLSTVLLAYPGEKHNLKNSSAKIDLTHRIQEWFDYYLKEKKDVEWIKKSIVVE